MTFNPLPMKLLGAALAVAALLWLVQSRSHWKDVAGARADELAGICAAAREASNNPRLACRDSARQVRHLGEAVGALQRSVSRQNAAIEAMERRSAEQQAAAGEAVAAARGRAEAALAVSGRLTGSSRSSERQAQPCAPSEALVDAWK